MKKYFADGRTIGAAMSIFDDIKTKGATYRLTEEELYGEALREIESGQRRDGIWAKALAESDMDHGKAGARYIKLRVQSLKDEVTLFIAELKLIASEHQKYERIRTEEISDQRDELTQSQIQTVREQKLRQARLDAERSSAEKQENRMRRLTINAENDRQRLARIQKIVLPISEWSSKWQSRWQGHPLSGASKRIIGAVQVLALLVILYAFTRNYLKYYT
jgi:hypothetical protein